MKTLEKMNALAAELRDTAVNDTSEETAGMVEMIQAAAGFGIDVFDIVFPKTEAEADVFVDKMLSLFMRMRGDDLPPFDINLYGDATTLPHEEETVDA